MYENRNTALTYSRCDVPPIGFPASVVMGRYQFLMYDRSCGMCVSRQVEICIFRLCISRITPSFLFADTKLSGFREGILRVRYPRFLHIFVGRFCPFVNVIALSFFPYRVFLDFIWGAAPCFGVLASV